MKTIATLLILFCGITFSHAQEKKLPNKEETEKYLVKMITEGNGKEYVWDDNNYVGNNSIKGYNYSTAIDDSDPYIIYHAGTEVVGCTKYGRYTESTLRRTKQFSNYDFKKLVEVKQTSKSVSNATSIQVTLVFNGKSIDYSTFYDTEFANCYKATDSQKTDKIAFYIANIEGNFDRFKKALFHYKDLLIAEQKQKIADDPFAN